MEIWRKINNDIIDERYVVSNLGRVKDIKKDFIYISKSKFHNNYISLYLKCKNESKKRFLLHRLVAQTFIKNPNNFPIINHIDGDKQNNNVNNLEWCTQQHNMICWVKNKSSIKKGE